MIHEVLNKVLGPPIPKLYMIGEFNDWSGFEGVVVDPNKEVMIFYGEQGMEILNTCLTDSHDSFSVDFIKDEKIGYIIHDDDFCSMEIDDQIEKLRPFIGHLID